MWLDWPVIPEYHQPTGRQSFPLHHSYLPCHYMPFRYPFQMIRISVSLAKIASQENEPRIYRRCSYGHRCQVGPGEFSSKNFGAALCQGGVLLIDPRRKSEKISVTRILTRGGREPRPRGLVPGPKNCVVKAGVWDEKKWGQWLPTGPPDFSVYQMFTIYPLIGRFLGRFHYNDYTPIL